MIIKPYHSDNTVVLRNPIAMSKYKLSLMQQKMFIEVACYLKNNPQQRICPVVVREFYNRIGINTNDNNELYAQMKQMLEMVIHIPKAKRKGQIAYLEAPMFASVEVMVDKLNRAIIEIEISDKLKPYFIEIADGDFFSYKIENTRKLKSTHSIKLYMYLRSWSRLGKHTITYIELRDILGVDVDDYRLFANFKCRVLDKAQIEIHEKTDLRFAYTLIRANPTNPNTPVEKISFSIDGGTKPVAEQIIIPLTIEPDHELVNLAHEVEKIVVEDLATLVGNYGRERVHDVLLLAKEQMSKGIKILSLTAYLHKTLKNNSATGKTKAGEIKKQQAKAILIDREIKALLHGGLEDYRQQYFNELGKSASQEIKTDFWDKMLSRIVKKEVKKEMIYDEETPKVDVLRELLGYELNTLSDYQLSLNFMESLGKPVVQEKGFWKYVAPDK